MTDLTDPRVATTVLVLAIWLTAWVVGLVLIRLRSQRSVAPPMPVLVLPALALWIAWVWLR